MSEAVMSVAILKQEQLRKQIASLVEEYAALQYAQSPFEPGKRARCRRPVR